MNCTVKLWQEIKIKVTSLNTSCYLTEVVTEAVLFACIYILYNILSSQFFLFHMSRTYQVWWYLCQSYYQPGVDVNKILNFRSFMQAFPPIRDNSNRRESHHRLLYQRAVGTKHATFYKLYFSVVLLFKFLQISADRSHFGICI
jgi:hypothetical protein